MKKKQMSRFLMPHSALASIVTRQHGNNPRAAVYPPSERAETSAVIFIGCQFWLLPFPLDSQGGEKPQIYGRECCKKVW